MDIIELKRSIRKLMLEKRRKLDIYIKDRYDHKICDHLGQIIKENNYKTIHAYLPIANEINILPLLNNLLLNNYRVIAPKTLPKRRLENRVLNSLADLETGVMGTKHPAGKEVYEGDYDLIIVPGLAYDKSNYRIGYGGGYYDNFIAYHPQAKKIGIFYPFQEITEVPIEPHDTPVDLILTKQIIE